MKRRALAAYVMITVLSACGPSANELNGRAQLQFSGLGSVFQSIGTCPETWPEAGESSVLPAKDVPCHEGPRKQCVLTDDPRESWEYSDAVYRNELTWGPLYAAGFRQMERIYFHISFEWEKIDGTCEYMMKVEADMDGNGIFSERTEGDRFGDGDGRFLRGPEKRLDE